MQHYHSDASPTEIEPEAFGAYRLTTAEIVFADAPGADASVVWRDYDLTPGFPRLREFLDRWRNDPVHRVRSVTVTEVAETWLPACRISPSTTALH